MITILHYFVAFFGGGLVLGYLIAEWYFQRIIDQLDAELGDCVAMLEELGVS